MIDLVTQHLTLDDPEQISPSLRAALLALAGHRKVSYEEFAARPVRQSQAEWLDGDIIQLREPSATHQRTVEFLFRLMRTYADVRGLGVVRTAPTQLHLNGSVRIPDVVFVANQNLDRVKLNHLTGAPDVVIEVVDSHTAASDRGAKFYEYERAHIPEYWLIDPHRAWAEFYVLDRLGRYQPGIVGDAGVFRSRAAQGFWLRLEWLWEPPHPSQALRELAPIMIR
jgi:Uma2 family endonuclease